MKQKINNQYKLPTTYKEALIQLLEKVEENEKLIEENSIDSGYFRLGGHS